MTKKKLCPFTKSPCIRSACALWVSDWANHIKSGKSIIKDTSDCAIVKSGEGAIYRRVQDDN